MNSDIQAAIAGLQASLQESIERLDDRQAARHAESSSQIAQLTQAVDHIQTRLNHTISDLSTLSARVESNEKKIKEILDREHHETPVRMDVDGAEQEPPPAKHARTQQASRSWSAPPKSRTTIAQWRDPSYSPGASACMEVRLRREEGFDAEEWTRHVHAACKYFKLETPEQVTTSRLFAVAALVTFKDPASADAFREALRANEYSIEGSRLWGDRCRTAAQKERGWRLRQCANSVREKLGTGTPSTEVRVDYRGRCIWHGRKELVRMSTDEAFVSGRHWPQAWTFANVVLGREWSSPSRG